jgi:hypothetical protein
MPLRNQDYSDREVLLAVQRVADADGVALAEDIAEDLGIRSDDGKRTPAGTVLARLSWMTTHNAKCAPDCRRHFGYLQRLDPRSLGFKASDPPRFVLTDLAQEILSGKVSAAITRELDKGNLGNEVLLMRELAQRGYIEADFSRASAIRREWQHNASRRFK